MEKFSQIDGLAAPLMRANIDTDIITPGKRIATTERDKMGEIAFEPLRFNPDGSENPDFVLNQDRYRGAEVLGTGPNFGWRQFARNRRLGPARAGYPLCHRGKLRRYFL